MDRLNAALDLARETGVKPEKADAAEWVKRKLAGQLPAGHQRRPTTRCSSNTRRARCARRSGCDRGGGDADDCPSGRLAWVRFEPKAVIGGSRDMVRYVLNIVSWSAGQCTEQTLAEVDPHGRLAVWEG